MAETIAEYMESYREEQRELIVRISWCYKKGKTGEFNSLQNCYEASARFDIALDVKTGEMLPTDSVAYKQLKWLVPKKKGLFGFKYGFKFEEGKIYRILAREYINKPTDKFVRYYIDDVLEYNIKDDRFDPVYLFESKFSEEVLELAVLIKGKICGWTCSMAYRMPGTTVIASVNLKTNEIDRHPFFLHWIEKESKLKLKYNFEALGIYHIRARKSKISENSYMLVNVVKKVQNQWLEEVKEEYKKPVIVTYKETEFTLNRRYNQFEGKLNYLGEKIDVFLHVSEENIAVKNHIRKLDDIYDNLLTFDSKVREYAAEELLEAAYDWMNDDMNEISKEEFMKRIGMPIIDIYNDGSMSLMYDSDGMFTDHVITIGVNANGDFEKATIEG